MEYGIVIITYSSLVEIKIFRCTLRFLFANFTISGLNASYMLGSLVSVIIQSWCLERKGDPNPFCVTNSEDLKLLTAGIILLVSVTAAFLNTCLTRNVNLPHSYRELKKWSEAMSDNRNSNDDMELVRVAKEKPGGETA